MNRAARDLQPGDIVVDGTGDRRTILRKRLSGNLIADTGVSPKTAAAIEFVLSGEMRIIVHPAREFQTA